jgi:cysteine-rich repeat protein
MLHELVLSVCRACIVGALLVLIGCQPSFCGDGTTDPGEACDDTNNNDADGCEADCSLPSCSNGIVDPGELCFLPPLALSSLPRSGLGLAFEADQDPFPELVFHLSANPPVFFDNEDGIFSVPQPLPTDELVNFIVAADTNEDGNQDLLFVDFQQNGNETLVSLFGNGDGTFSQPVIALIPPANEKNFVLIDLDQDGHLDLFYRDIAEEEIHLLFGTGTGGFTDFVPLAIPSNAIRDVLTADVDQDGDFDLIIHEGFELEPRLFIARNDGNRFFTILPPQAIQPDTEQMTLVDLNADSFPDIVSRIFDFINNKDFVQVLLNNQDSTFTETTTIDIDAFEVLVHDIDQNGTPDLLIGQEINFENTLLQVHRNDGTGSFVQDGELLFLGSRDTRSVVADFNLDGALDVVGANDGGSIRLFLSNP